MCKPKASPVPRFSDWFTIPYSADSPPKLATGEIVEVIPGIRRLLAPNPSVMTGPGTNTYLIGEIDIVVIDPGPVDEVHLARICDAVGDHLRYVVVTHSHRDHAPGALPLARATGATLLGFDERPGFVPDGRIGEGDVVVADHWRLEALHTPGHASDHLCFVADSLSAALEPRVLFSGDHIMGGSTVVVGPPDGDMSVYLNSLERVRSLEPPCDVIAPGHGQMMPNPKEVIADYVIRRLAREAAIVAAIRDRPYRAGELVPVVYNSLSEALVRPATRTIWAHLRKLYNEGRAWAEDPDDPESVWQALNN